MKDFWIPYECDLSPHTQQASASMMRWASRHGLIKGDLEDWWLEQWHPESLVGRVYAPCSAEDLELAACWFAWLFVVDDTLDVSRADAASDIIQGITAILREDNPGLAGDGAPAVIKTLADLWDRTREPMSKAWRQRAAYSFSRCLEATAWESGNRGAHQVPSLEAYYDMRRWGGGTYFCFDLLERFQRFEMSVGMMHCGPVEALRLYACDHVDWVNDVISSGREAARRDVHNLVLILENTYGLSRDQAVGHVVEMANERMRAFLSVEDKILPGYLETLSKDDGRAVRQAVSGWRAWMRGSLDWHLATARYHDHMRAAVNPFVGSSGGWAFGA